MDERLSHAIESRSLQFARERAIERIWARDYTLWKPEPEEISDRLGWLEVAGETLAELPALEAFAAGAAADGLTSVLLLGMGGSSLGPEVIRQVFGNNRMDLLVLDSTHPAQIREAEAALDFARTLVLVSSKSGTTIETVCQADYFWDKLRNGRQFAAITDPGSKLATTARERGFRRLFENRADIGGRYSVLSHFGMVPAALVGAPTDSILRDAVRMAEHCRESADIARNPGASLGILLGEAALAGRDKCMLALPRALQPLTGWIEQLVAESLGKEGRGILPVPCHELLAPESYGPDRVFIAYEHSPALGALEAAGHPVVVIPSAGMGGEFFRWEFATAVAGAVLSVQPFDQPNVQEAKDAAGVILAGRTPDVTPMPVADLLRTIEPGDYIAINAFVPRNAANEARLAAVLHHLEARHHVAVTAGFGPRFLHSTGQLHKGGPASGAFIEVVDDIRQDIPIPGRPYTFGQLLEAQALGDLAALLGRGRRAARVSIDELETIAAH